MGGGVGVSRAGGGVHCTVSPSQHQVPRPPGQLLQASRVQGNVSLQIEDGY